MSGGAESGGGRVRRLTGHGRRRGVRCDRSAEVMCDRLYRRVERRRRHQRRRRGRTLVVGTPVDRDAPPRHPLLLLWLLLMVQMVVDVWVVGCRIADGSVPAAALVLLSGRTSGCVHDVGGCRAHQLSVSVGDKARLGLRAGQIVAGTDRRPAGIVCRRHESGGADAVVEPVAELVMVFAAIVKRQRLMVAERSAGRVVRVNVHHIVGSSSGQ